MTAQLNDVHERGREAVAILWASEPVIYGRFGYGLASNAYSVKVPRNAHALRADSPSDPALRLRLVPAEDWKLTADVYAAAAAARPGMIARDERWHRRAASDYPSLREGRSALRCVVAEDDTGVRGYARYSTKPDWSTPVPSGTVHVREVIAVDGAALAALYRYLFDLDLMGVADAVERARRQPAAALAQQHPGHEAGLAGRAVRAAGRRGHRARAAPLLRPRRRRPRGARPAPSRGTTAAGAWSEVPTVPAASGPRTSPTSPSASPTWVRPTSGAPPWAGSPRPSGSRSGRAARTCCPLSRRPSPRARHRGARSSSDPADHLGRGVTRPGRRGARAARRCSRTPRSWRSAAHAARRR